MINQQKEPNCENCGLRKLSDEKPGSIIARIWKWHTGWCPGWKAYQDILAEKEKGQASSAGNT